MQRKLWLRFDPNQLATDRRAADMISLRLHTIHIGWSDSCCCVRKIPMYSSCKHSHRLLPHPGRISQSVFPWLWQTYFSGSETYISLPLCSSGSLVANPGLFYMLGRQTSHTRNLVLSIHIVSIKTTKKNNLLNFL